MWLRSSLRSTVRVVVSVLVPRNGRLITLLLSSTLVLGWAILGIRSVDLNLVLQDLRTTIGTAWDVGDFDVEDVSNVLGSLSLCPEDGEVMFCRKAKDLYLELSECMALVAGSVFFPLFAMFSKFKLLLWFDSLEFSSSSIKGIFRPS